MDERREDERTLTEKWGSWKPVTFMGSIGISPEKDILVASSA
jgi:hypothetical protein